MKKCFLFAVSAILLAGCTTELDSVGGNDTGTSNAISFMVDKTNQTRATAMNEAGHYNFGVYAYKSTDKMNGIMDNYLVGYKDDEKAYSASGTTVGDASSVEDGKSLWMYEGMGCDQYYGSYAGQPLVKGTDYASNVDKQYLRYWDKAAPNTYFYAYAPYMNTTAKGMTVTYVDGTAQGESADTYMMTFPDGSIEHGYDDPTRYEYLYASAKVANTNYGHDVALQFKHINAKVNIKFWENIQGYSVRIIDINDDYSVSAVPAIKDGTSGGYGYKLGEIFSKNGAKIQFADGAATAVTPLTGTKVSTPLNFAAPEDATIGENRVNASPSATTYYAVPKSDETGLTFHVSYEMLSTSGEKIIVRDATAFIPTDYTNWEAGKHYTYIFKITKSSNGTTDPTVVPKPEDPEVPTVQALYPIVFDNCTIEDWVEIDSEHNISDDTNANYHDVQLSTHSLVNGEIEVTVIDNDTWEGHAINYANIKVKRGEEDLTTTWYNATTHKITVPAGATAGLYTVTYTCQTGAYYNHPNADSWSDTFVVGNAYTVTTNQTVIGTGGQAASSLVITTTKDTEAEATAGASGQLYVDYPAGVSSTDKVKVEGGKIVVAADAPEDFYKLIYKVDNKKVAEQVFEVRSYQHNLSKSTIYLNGVTQTIVSTHPGQNDELKLDAGAPAGITIDNSNYTISVTNDVPAGTYKVYYTVDKGSSDSKVTYVRSFEVKQTISVAVSKTSIDRNEGTSTSGQYTTDAITVTTKQNGIETTTDLSAALSVVKADKTATDDGNFNFVYDAATHKYTLRCKNTVPTGNYYVKFAQTLDGEDVTEYAIFTVQE